MPEIPEVEAYKQYIASDCLHKKIKDVEIYDSRLIKKISASSFKKNLTGASFQSIERKGKYLILSTSKQQQLVMHFALTGFVIVTKNKDKVNHDIVEFIFAPSLALHWCDIRKFARIWLVADSNEIKAIKELGADALTIKQKEFNDLVEKNRSKNIKAFLMDQSIIAGIGNEYSDEILFQAGIDPHHRLQDLSPNQIKKIYQKMHSVLKYAIKLRIKHVKDLAKGKLFTGFNNGVFKSSYLQAHRHIDGVCPKNKNHKLKKATIAGRSTYYCPEDQK